MGCFLPFDPPNSPKNWNFEKMKKISGDIIIWHMCSKNYDQVIYSSWDMLCDGCNYFSFWAIFWPFIPLTAKNIKILKKWKNAWRYHHFTIVYQKSWSDDVRFLRYASQQMDGRTDRRKKWHIEVGVPPKNCWNGPIKNTSILIFTEI